MKNLAVLGLILGGMIFGGAMGVYHAIAITSSPHEILAKADAAYDHDDFARAGLLLPSLAESGYAKAQYRLGRLYEYGQGVPQDYDLAFYWYSRAAAQDYKPAAHILRGWQFSKRKRIQSVDR